MRNVALTCALLVAMGSSAHAETLQALTPSGLPDTIFVETKLAAASNRIVTTCMDMGWPVLQQADNQVACQLPLVGFDAAMETADVRNGAPKQFMRVNLVQIGEHTRAQAQVMLEAYSPSGPSQRPIRTASMDNAMFGFLEAAGGQLPTGTTFPNTLYLGIQLSARDNKIRAIIEKVAGNSPASAAGLQTGDQIVSVEGKPIKSATAAIRALNKIRLGSIYNIEVDRNGEKRIISVRAQIRPPITELATGTDLRSD